MSDAEVRPQSEQPQGPMVETLYEPWQIDVSINRYRLLMILAKCQGQKSLPHYDAALPWLGVMLAFLLALLPSDFQDFLGISANVWQGAMLFGAISAGLIALRALYLAHRHRNDEIETPEFIVDQLVSEMSPRTKRAYAATAVGTKDPSASGRGDDA